GGEMREQLRQFREFRIAGAERRRAFAGKAGEPVEHVHGIVGAALFAVIYYVDAAFDLLLHHTRDRLADCGVKLGLARAGILLLGEQELDHLGGTRQAAGMRGENPFVTAFHATAIRQSALVLVHHCVRRSEAGHQSERSRRDPEAKAQFLSNWQRCRADSTPSAQRSTYSSTAFPRFESYPRVNQPRPEERALARVSKDGHKRHRASGHPSRRRFAPPQDEVCVCLSFPRLIRLVSWNRSTSCRHIRQIQTRGWYLRAGRLQV